MNKNFSKLVIIVSILCVQSYGAQDDFGEGDEPLGGLEKREELNQNEDEGYTEATDYSRRQIGGEENEPGQQLSDSPQEPVDSVSPNSVPLTTRKSKSHKSKKGRSKKKSHSRKSSRGGKKVKSKIHSDADLAGDTDKNVSPIKPIEAKSVAEDSEDNLDQTPPVNDEGTNRNARKRPILDSLNNAYRRIKTRSRLRNNRGKGFNQDNSNQSNI